jgi:uncharacterized protein (TIGR01777 family)
MQDSRKAIITGGSGFLGSNISKKLLADGWEVVSADIAPPADERVTHADVNLLADDIASEKLADPEAVINLAGKNIFGRWNEEFKEAVYKTRVDLTENLVELFNKEKYRPDVFVSASAAGYYGDRGDEKLNTRSSAGTGFLAKVSRDWEAAARQAEDTGVPTTIIRNGHILGAGGLLGVLLPFYRWGLGGPLSSGEQWFPWVHVDDIARMYIAAVEQEGEPETVNGVAPEQVTNKEFSKQLAGALGRPHLLRIPGFVLRLLFGEFGKEMLYSQRIETQADDKLNFEYRYKKLRLALKDIASK